MTERDMNEIRGVFIEWIDYLLDVLKGEKP